MVEEMIPKKNLLNFYAKFCKLPTMQRTNTKIAQMLEEIGCKIVITWQRKGDE